MKLMASICSEVGSIQEAWSLNVIVHVSCPEYPFERNKGFYNNLRLFVYISSKECCRLIKA